MIIHGAAVGHDHVHAPDRCPPSCPHRQAQDVAVNGVAAVALSRAPRRLFIDMGTHGDYRWLFVARVSRFSSWREDLARLRRAAAFGDDVAASQTVVVTLLPPMLVLGSSPTPNMMADPHAVYVTCGCAQRWFHHNWSNRRDGWWPDASAVCACGVHGDWPGLHVCLLDGTPAPEALQLQLIRDITDRLPADPCRQVLVGDGTIEPSVAPPPPGYLLPLAAYRLEM